MLTVAFNLKHIIRFMPLWINTLYMHIKISKYAIIFIIFAWKLFLIIRILYNNVNYSN